MQLCKYDMSWTVQVAHVLVRSAAGTRAAQRGVRGWMCVAECAWLNVRVNVSVINVTLTKGW